MFSAKAWIGVVFIISQTSIILVAALDSFKCEYFYSAHFHMYHTKDIYFNTDLDVLKSNPIDVISFEREACLVVDIFHYSKNLPMDDIWLVYIYTYKIKKFYEARANVTLSDEVGSIAKALEMHDFVFAQIQNYLIINDCKKDINYNGQFDINNIKTNKKAISYLIFMEYNRPGLPTETIKFPTDYVSWLYFVNEDVQRPFFNEFSMDPRSQRDWYIAIDSLANTRQRTHIAGLDGIKSLAVYRLMFIDMLKVIMLRLAWRYTNALSINLSNGPKSDFAAVLKKFHDRLCLNDDQFFLNLSNLFDRQFVKDDIIKKIKEGLNSLPIAKGHLIVAPELQEGFENILEISKRFIEKLTIRYPYLGSVFAKKEFDNMVVNKFSKISY